MRVGQARLGEQHARGLAQFDQRLQRGHRQPLAGPHVERHPRPAPGLDREPAGHERLDRRVGGDALLLAVALVLAAHDRAGVERGHRLEHLELLVAQGVGGRADGRLHRQHRDHLHQMVLHHVAQRPDALVEPAPPFDAELLGHGDLHAAHVVAVPDRLEERVGEPEHQQVLDGLLAQVVVDPEDVGLGEPPVEQGVELLGRGQVAPERLLDHHPRALGEALAGQALDHGREGAGRDGQVEHRVRRSPPGQLGTQPRERGGVGVVAAADQAQPRDQARHHGGLGSGHRVEDGALDVGAEPVGGPRRAGDTHDRHVQGAGRLHPVQRGEQLLAGQVAGRPEQDEGVGSSRGMRPRAGLEQSSRWGHSLCHGGIGRRGSGTHDE